MLSLHEAFELEFSCGVQGLDIISSGFGFSPWGPDTPPTLDEATNVSDVASPPTVALDDGEERRLRRKISNRESARRSRLRKKQRLEELRQDAARLLEEKGKLVEQLQAVARQGLAARSDNARLRAKVAMLGSRLREAHRFVALKRLCLQRLPLLPLNGSAGRGGAPVAPVGFASLMT